MSARAAMRDVGAGRLAIGLGLVAAPVALGQAVDRRERRRRRRPGRAARTGLARRAAGLHGDARREARSDPLIAARWSAAIALCDVVDGVATGAVRDDAGPRADAVIALALGSARRRVRRSPGACAPPPD